MKRFILLFLLSFTLVYSFSYTYLPCPRKISNIDIPCYINKPGIYQITTNIFFNPSSCFLNNNPILNCPFILINTSNIVINGENHKIKLSGISSGFVIQNKSNITIENMYFLNPCTTDIFVNHSKNIVIKNISIFPENIINTSIIFLYSNIKLKNVNIKNINYPIISINSSFSIWNSNIKYYQNAIGLYNSFGKLYKTNVTNGIFGLRLNNSKLILVNSNVKNNSNGILILNNSKLYVNNSYICKNINDIVFKSKNYDILIKNSVLGSFYMVYNNGSKKLNNSVLKKILGKYYKTNRFCNTISSKNKTILPKHYIIANNQDNRIVINKEYLETCNIVNDLTLIIFIIIVVIIALYFMIFKKI